MLKKSGVEALESVFGPKLEKRMDHGVACPKCVEQCLHEKHNGCAIKAPVPAAEHPRFLKTVLDDGFMRSFTVCYFFSMPPQLTGNK